ncbi:MAG: TIGR00341 family protein [Porphyromonas sp.]|nr:TIGR00341 family protein [Porphyromonas sp.]
MEDIKKLTLKDLIEKYFDLNREKENEDETIHQVKSDVEFKGAKIWILISAILIASIGLNMNSTAVVIGAMLISPLMGPIIGLGLGLGIVDFDLVKKSVRNYLFAVITAIITSTIYFAISPISNAQSELLARTQPTVYDLFIALFGGVAGMVAVTTRSKGQVLPGVAIATALMPPLCTAGYGLGTGQMSFFFGALYLFIINTVFIAMSTFVVVKVLKFRQTTYVNAQRGRRIRTWMLGIVLLTAIPSVYLASIMIRDNVEQQRVSDFVKKEIDIDGTFLMGYDFTKSDSINLLNVSLFGRKLESDEVKMLQDRLEQYGLHTTELNILQEYDQGMSEEIRNSILLDLNKQKSTSDGVIQYLTASKDSLQKRLTEEQLFYHQGESVRTEIIQLFETISDIQVAKMYHFYADSTGVDTIPLIRLYTTKKLSKEQEEVLKKWLSVRYTNPEVEVLLKKK